LSSRDEFLVFRDKEVVQKYGVGHCTPKTMNTAGFYLHAVVGPVSILTSMLYADLLAQTISDISK